MRPKSTPNRLSQVIRDPGRYSNQETSECKSRALSMNQPPLDFRVLPDSLFTRHENSRSLLNAGVYHHHAAEVPWLQNCESHVRLHLTICGSLTALRHATLHGVCTVTDPQTAVSASMAGKHGTSLLYVTGRRSTEQINSLPNR
jgi:hypothetical protein